MTGLTDLHKENVLWDANGKPFLIDADNALKLRMMTPAEARAQSGYTLYNETASSVITEVYKSAENYETSIMQALKTPGTAEQRLLLSKTRAVFRGSKGRVVPIATKNWGAWLETFIVAQTEGSQADVYKKDAEFSKWMVCNFSATKVPKGYDRSTGLNGEVGVSGGTDGDFAKAVEAAQIFADFKHGQIPFYEYEYGSGYVKHNGQVIWKGQTIEERMAILFELFPKQRRWNLDIRGNRNRSKTS